MIVIAPLASRCPSSAASGAAVLGFGLLALSGVALAVGIERNAYGPILPGLIVFGVALALVLTVNDPVTLDQVPALEQGQASGVSATAEQFGGAVGISALYLVFHASYSARLNQAIARSPLPKFTAETGLRFKNDLLAAEQTGLNPQHF